MESGFNTVTGRAALEKIAAYVQESEAVNTAMATRIYDLLDREARLSERVANLLDTEARLSERLAVAERKNILHWRLLSVSFVIQGITVIAVLYLICR